MINIAVTGGRTGNDKCVVWHVMDELHWLLLEFTVAHGDAAGVDTFVEQWCRYRKIPVIPFPINPFYDGYDYQVAPKNRNIRMLEIHRPSVLVAFPGGPGTRHAFKEAERRGLTILDIDIDDAGNFSIWRINNPKLKPAVIATAKAIDRPDYE